MFFQKFLVLGEELVFERTPSLVKTFRSFNCCKMVLPIRICKDRKQKHVKVTKIEFRQKTRLTASARVQP